MGEYQRGIAFIVEGSTERVFFEEYIKHLADRHDDCRVLDCDFDEDSLVVVVGERRFLTRFNNVGTVTQMPNSFAWFDRSCYGKHPQIPWTVFLCYDTDSYNAPVSKFQSDSWKLLRQDLCSRSQKVIEIAASADIEDVMLEDFSGVLSFLNLPLTTAMPSGNKGKSKMKKLFKERSPQRPYHEGERARPLIRALDLDKITRCSPLPLKKIARSFGLSI